MKSVKAEFRTYSFGDKEISEIRTSMLDSKISFVCGKSPINFDPSDITNLLRTCGWKHGAWKFYVFFWNRRDVSSIERPFSAWWPLLDAIDRVDDDVAGLTRIYRCSGWLSLVTPNRKYFKYILKDESRCDALHQQFRAIAEAEAIRCQL